MARGRQPEGEHTLSNAERQARYRARRKADQPTPVVRYRRPVDRRTRRPELTKRPSDTHKGTNSERQRGDSESEAQKNPASARLAAAPRETAVRENRLSDFPFDGRRHRLSPHSKGAFPDIEVCEVWPSIRSSSYKFGGAAPRTRRRQMAGLQSLLDWFSAHQSALTSIGAGLVVIIGGLWQLYVYLDAKKDKLNQTSRNPQPIVLPLVLPSTPAAPPADMQRAPLRVIEGRYSLKMYPKESRSFKVFGCAFLAFWCLTLFWSVVLGLGQMARHLGDQFLLPVFFVFFSYVVMSMLYSGIVSFLGELTLLTGKAKVFAGREIIIISRSLRDSFSNHTIILASEWRFDGEVFVSRADGTKAALPNLPEYVRLELIKLLNAAWR